MSNVEQRQTDVDVVVVGGGSAGSTAAIRAQQGLALGRVLLLEKAHVKRSGAIAIEVDYMFHGPLGIQTRDFTIKPEVRKGIAVALDTLQLLKKTDTTLDLATWIDDRYIRQAAREMGIDYDARLKSYGAVPLSGKDARTGEAIHDAHLAGQIWVRGEAKVRAYATPASTLAALKDLERTGGRARVAFVHDRETGLKLFAGKAWFVENNKGIVVSAFLLKERADGWGREHAPGGRVIEPGKAAPTTTAALP